MQSCSLEIFAAQQKSQIDVYQELTRSNKDKEHDALFTSIPVFDGDCTQCEQWLMTWTKLPELVDMTWELSWSRNQLVW